MSLKRPRPRAEDFTIAWVSALPIELNAAEALLDDEYEDGDNTAQYKLGRIGRHNVVVVCLPAGQTGTAAAAAVAVELRHKFPAVKIGLMVGIGGGVPSSNADIRLGDVIISQPDGPYGGVVQYDFGKTGSDGLHTRTGYLNAPPPVLLTAVSRLRSNRLAGKRDIPVYLSPPADCLETYRRSAGSDILFQASYGHVGGPNCDQCDKDMIVCRTLRDSEEPVIHYGLIASGNQVMKDGLSRDKLSSQLGGVLCFEMEAAGLMNYLPSLVIRGICDYADSHKNKKWQPFAAAAAAACAKEILLFVPSDSHSSRPDIGRISDTDSHHMRPNTLYTEPKSSLPTSHQVPETTLNSAIKPVLTEDQRQRLLESLRFDQIDARHETIKIAHTKTCKWLLSRPEYQDWLDPKNLPDHHGFLWVKGKPGTGKSTLMKFAFSNAKKTMMDATIISFFFNARGEELEKSTLGMYRSLLLQLLDKLPHLQSAFDLLGSVALSNIESHQWDIESVKKLFRGAIKEFKQGHLICFIDALDECEEDEVREMVAFLEDLGRLAVSIEFRFHICFSSRHYPYITIERGIELVLEGQEGHKEDIANYLDSELKAGKTKLVKQIKAEILERSSGIFLWVALVVPILQKEYDHGRISALRKRLNEIPDGLDELFKDILTRDDQNIDELILCLQWILYSMRPLKCEELYFAILAGVEKEALTEWSSEDITKEDMERRILSSSKGLAEMTRSKKQTVQFIHESVRDFLLKGNALHRLRPDLVNNFSGLSHEQLKQCCQNYMKIDISEYTQFLSEGVSSKDAASGRQLVLERFPFLDYAVRNVLPHADAARGYGTSQDTFIENFRFPCWNTLNNSIERYQTRRHTSDRNLLHILAERNLTSLIQIELERVQPFDINLRDKHGRTPLWLATEKGHEAVVKQLLMTGQADVNSKDKSERTPLWLATEKGHEAVVKQLLMTGQADVNSRDKHGRTPLSLVAEKGHEAVVKQLLMTGQADVNSRDKHGRTPLSLAAENGHEAVVKQLLMTGQANVNSKDKNEQTPLSFATKWENEAIVKLLLENGANLEFADNYFGWTLLFAAEKGNEAIAKLLLEKGANLESKDNSNQMPLLLAAHNGNEAIAKLLLEKGANLEFEDNYSGRPLLLLAAEKGNEAIAKLVLEKGADLESRNGFGRTPLLLAVENGNGAIAKLLLQQGADLESKDGIGWTPLLLAVEKGNGAIAKMLLEQGVKLESKNNSGHTPLLLAAENGNEAIAKLLLEKGADLESRGNFGRTPLLLATVKGNEAIAKLLLEKGADFESRDIFNRTPLLLAAEKGNEAIAKLLLETGTDLESKDSSNWTPLLLAARKGNEAIAKLLLEKGANLESKDTSGQTSLSFATEQGNEAIAKLLLEKGANLESRDNFGRTPLLLATEKGNEAITKLLLEKDANLESRDSSGRTPLLIAIERGNEAIVKLLLEKDADLEFRDDSGLTLLLLAKIEGNESIAKMLLEKGNETIAKLLLEKRNETIAKLLLEKDTNLMSKDNASRMLLLLAAEKGNEVTAKLLLEKGADLESRDNFGRTPLLLATEKGNEAIAKLLLEKGDDFESRDIFDRTPVLLATEKGNEEIVKLLLEKGADLESKDSFGRTPLLLAKEKGNEAIAKLLLEKGAELKSINNSGRL